MGIRQFIMIGAAAATLCGCAAQSRVSQNPVWASSGINGLQRSQCNCGGIERKKVFKARREAEARAQFNSEGGRK